MSLLQRPLLQPPGGVHRQAQKLAFVGGQDEAVPLGRQRTFQRYSTARGVSRTHPATITAETNDTFCVTSDTELHIHQIMTPTLQRYNKNKVQKQFLDFSIFTFLMETDV